MLNLLSICEDQTTTDSAQFFSHPLHILMNANSSFRALSNIDAPTAVICGCFYIERWIHFTEERLWVLLIP